MLNTHPPSHHKPGIIAKPHPTAPTLSLVNLEPVFAFIGKEVKASNISLRSRSLPYLAFRVVCKHHVTCRAFLDHFL